MAREANKAKANEPVEPAEAPMEEAAAVENAPDAAEGVESSGKQPSRLPFAGMRSSNVVLGRISSQDIVFPHVLSPWIAVRKHGGAVTAYQIVNIRTGRWGDAIPIEGHPQQIALSPDGATLAVASVFEPKITLYTTSNGKKSKRDRFTRTWRLHVADLYQCAAVAGDW